MGKVAARVLVVDDDPGVLRMLVAVLRREGFDVREARDGREALDVLSGGDIDLVLLDLMMPVMNGWDVLDVRKGDPSLRAVPIIVITANVGPETSAILQHGVSALLPKPFDLTHLAEIVNSCLGRPPQPAVPA